MRVGQPLDNLFGPWIAHDRHRADRLRRSRSVVPAKPSDQFSKQHGPSRSSRSEPHQPLVWDPASRRQVGM